MRLFARMPMMCAVILAGAAHAASVVDPRPDIQPLPTSGVIKIPLPDGMLIPRPKSVTLPGGMIELAPGAACAIALAGEPSVTEKTAAAEIAEQIAFLSAGNLKLDVIPDSESAEKPFVIILGTASEAFKKYGVEIPDHADGFALKTVTDGGRKFVLLAGRDKFGVFWGAQTLKQLLKKREASVIIPACEITDWPDAAYRMTVGLDKRSPETLAFLVRWGRVNLDFFDAFEWDGHVKTKEEIAKGAAFVHAYGIRHIPLWSMYASCLEKFLKEQGETDTVFCPVKHFQYFQRFITMWLEAGVDGIQLDFDDMTEAQFKAFADCPQCKEKFTSLGEAQAFLMSEAVKIADRFDPDHRMMHLACPTLYSFRPGHEKESVTHFNGYDGYFKSFFDFPESSRMRFHFCGFTREHLARLSKNGFKNYVWWNNGIWPSDHGEMWGYYVNFPKMALSWDMVDERKLQNEATYTENKENLAELKFLKGKTDLIYTGTGDVLGQTLGGIFGWDIVGYMDDEAATRAALINELFENPDAAGAVAVWERTTPSLIAKYRNNGLFDKSDAEEVLRAKSVYEKLAANKTPLVVSVIPRLKTVVNTLEAYSAFCAKFSLIGEPLTVTAKFPKAAGGTLLWITPETVESSASALDAQEWKLRERPIQAVSLDGVKGFLFNKNAIERVDTVCNLSGKTFTIEVRVTPFNLTWSKIIGTRNTIREVYPKNPGWAIGVEPSGKVRFTVEDVAGGLSTIISSQSLPKFVTTHLVAIRDVNAKKLFLYMNGVKVGETEETGTGSFGSADTLKVSHDDWTGGYFSGLVHAIKLYDHALAPEEALNASRLSK